MDTNVAEIEAQIRALSREERADLIRSLIADLDGAPETDVERAWTQEAVRRHREVDDGEVQPVSGDRVFAAVNERLRE